MSRLDEHLERLAAVAEANLMLLRQLDDARQRIEQLERALEMQYRKGYRAGHTAGFRGREDGPRKYNRRSRLGETA